MPSASLVAAPRLPPDLSPAPAAPLEDHERWEGLDIAGLSFPGLTARGAEIVRSRLTDCDLSSAQLRGVGLTDCEVLDSNLANVMAIEGTMSRCAFSGCRLTGFAWPQGLIENVRFADCLIDLAAFGFARLRRVVFEDCILRDADFREARMDTVGMYRCDLSTASFSGAAFERSELRGCTLDDIRGVEGLRGAAMDWGDVVGLAGTMASALGIRVIEDV